jgi:hypothetical protein
VRFSLTHQPAALRAGHQWRRAALPTGIPLPGADRPLRSPPKTPETSPDTDGIDWIEILLQVGFAAVGVALVAGIRGRRTH